MNQREAFRETILLAEIAGMSDHDTMELGLPHMRSMYARITDDFSDGKLGRWLGWAQCALVAANVGVTLDDMKSLNKKWSDQ